MLFVAKQQLPTPAALSELDCRATKPEPHGQDLIRFHSGNTSRTCFEMLQPQPQQMKPVDDPSPIKLHRHGLASIAVPQNCCKGFPHRPKSISRTEISIGSNAGITSIENFSKTNGAGKRSGLLQRASINTERTRLHVLSAKGQHARVAKLSVLCE